MFKFKSNQNPMLTAVKDIIGTREQYINFTKKYSLTKDEKDTLLQASIHANKKIPNMNIIHDAYELMMVAGAIEGGEKKSVNEEEKAGENSTSDAHVDSKKKKKFFEQKSFRWLAFGVIFFIILLAELGMPASGIVILSLVTTLLIWGFELLLGFIAKLEKKAPSDRPKEVKYASFILKVAFIFSILVGLFAIGSMVAHDNHSYATSRVLAYIGFIIGAGIVLNWYVLKAIIRGVKWVKTAYLILIFISLFTFFPSWESMTWMKSIYKFNFVVQEILAIIVSILLLQPSSTRWFESKSMKKQDNSKASAIYESAIQAINKTSDSKNSVSYIEEIRKLGELKEDGLLTEEEFLQQKQKLLNNQI